MKPQLVRPHGSSGAYKLSRGGGGGGALNHARGNDSTSLVSLRVARRTREDEDRTWCTELPRGSPRFTAADTPRSLRYPKSAQLSDTLRVPSCRGSTARSAERNSGFSERRVFASDLGVIPARNAALTHLLSLSLALLSRVPGLRHTQLYRALFLTLLRHDGAQTTTLIGAAQCVCASRERRNVESPAESRVRLN